MNIFAVSDGFTEEVWWGRGGKKEEGEGRRRNDQSPPCREDITLSASVILPSAETLKLSIKSYDPKPKSSQEDGKADRPKRIETTSQCQKN